MANGDDGLKSSWTSWFSPGDSRHVKSEAQQHNPDIEAKRPIASPAPEHESHSSHRSALEDVQVHPLSPLVAFKHFIDDQFTALAEFPTNMNLLMEKARADADAHSRRRTEPMRQASNRWTGNDDVEFDARLWEAGYEPTQASKIAATMLIREACQKNRHVPVEKIADLYHDFGNIGCSRVSTGFLSIHWFKRSPYSPLVLEADPVLGKYDTKWRHAFEDLLEAALDKPMTSEERFGQRDDHANVVSTWRAPGLDWMSSLQCRGILPPQLPAWWNFQLGRNHPTSLLTLEKRLGTPRVNTSELCSQPIDDFDIRCGKDFTSLTRELATPIPRNTEQATTELDIYEQLEAIASKEDLEAVGCRAAEFEQGDTKGHGAFEDQEQTVSGRCPDELGRAVHAARREGERATDQDILDKFDHDFFLANHDADAEEQAQAEIEARATFQQLRGLIEASQASPDAREKLIDGLLDVLSDSRLRDSACDILEEEKGSLRRNMQGDPMMMMLLEHDRVKERLLRERQEPDARQDEYDGSTQATDDEKESLQAQSTTMRLSNTQTVESGMKRPQVLSTMTKTQTTRLPDGRVKTEVVLKRRFADGREETQKSTQTSFDGSGNAGGGDDDDDNNNNNNNNNNNSDNMNRQQTKDSKGWFWS